MTRTDQILICQLVADLLIVDAAVTIEEPDYLDALFDRFGFDAETRQSVYDAVNVDDDVAARARAIEPEAHEALLGALHDAANADGVLGRGEIEIIERVRAALGLDGAAPDGGVTGSAFDGASGDRAVDVGGGGSDGTDGADG